MSKAAVVGTFDGVHRGHRYLLDALRREASARGLEPLALTFSTHPLSVIVPGREPLVLTSVAGRKQLIEEAGVEVEVLDFNDDLRRMTSAEFLDMLRRRYGVTTFLLGFNNTIGSDRLSAADIPDAGIAGVEVLAAAEHPDFAVSSSAIRAALARGDVEAAAEMLGRPYALSSPVVHGRQLGRTLGFPTANIEVPDRTALPAVGVYVGRMLGHRAVVNVGRRPTVEGRTDAPLSIEAHLLDYSGDLYGREVTLEFLGRLRGECRFGSLSELKDAIATDIKHAREYGE